MSQFNIRVSGPEAKQLATDLSRRLAEDLGGEYLPRELEANERSEDTHRADPVAVAALIISIPSGILATIQLAERMELVSKWRALRAWAQDRLGEGQRLELEGPGLEPRALPEAEASEVIDAAISADQGDPK